MKRATTVGMLLTMFTNTLSARSQEHLVSQARVEMRLAEAAKERTQDIDVLESLLVSPEGLRAAAAVGVDNLRVARALPVLSGAELHDLARRAEAIKENPVAGMGHTGKVILITALVTTVVLIVIAFVIASRSLNYT